MRCRSQGLPDRKAASTCACARLATPGRGHRPCHSATLPLSQPGAKAPGQRPPRHRRALASVSPGPSAVRGTVPRGRGNAGRVSCSRPDRRRDLHRVNGRGHRPCHSATLPLARPGAKAPGQRPHRPWRALRTRRVGRWPLFLPGLPVYRVRSRRGGGNALRFLFPPERAKGPSPRKWQGPSPLPRHNAAPWPARGRSPRPAPAPPLAGALQRPGRALASVPPGPAGLQGTVPRGRGNAGRVSCSRPNGRGHPHRFNGRGHRP
jgi:hypothetical protein